MGFFDSAKSHVELLEKDCRLVGELAGRVRDKCDASIRGKYDYTPADQRAALVRDGQELLGKVQEALAAARERQKVMESDQCPNEDLLAAQTLLLSAGLDVSRAEKAVGDARTSLVGGIAEIEAFYGERSKEAKEFRKILAEHHIAV